MGIKLRRSILSTFGVLRLWAGDTAEARVPPPTQDTTADVGIQGSGVASCINHPTLQSTASTAREFPTRQRRQAYLPGACPGSFPSGSDFNSNEKGDATPLRLDAAKAMRLLHFLGRTCPDDFLRLG
jgi:hypothetical protein